MLILARLLISSAALLALAELLPGIVIDGWYAAIITALFLGLINAIIRPIVIFLTFPITVVTLGLFTFVVNALLFWFVSTFVQGFHVENFWSAFLGALIMSIVGSIVNAIIKK